MNITNELELPRAFVEMARREESFPPNAYRVTSLLKGVREAILERRHADEIAQDVSEMIWMLWGTTAHAVLDNQQEGEYEIKETRLTCEFGKYILSGKFDLYEARTGTVTDYKTCSAWKVVYGDYEDWRRQLLMYAYMLRREGFKAERGEIIAIMRDHSKRDAKFKADYPKHPVKKITFAFSDKDFDEIEAWVQARFDLIAHCEALPDNELPICAPEERFNSGDKFAVMKKGRKTAMRVLDSLVEARQWMADNGGDEIVTRPGEDKKCADYCSCCEFCNYYHEHVKTEEAIA